MTYIERIFDATTGETVERQYTTEEIAEVEAKQEQAKALAQAEAEKAAIKAAAQAKLAALGLTQEEIAALSK